MKRITRIVAAAALAISFAVGATGTVAGAQEMDHGRSEPSALYLRAR